MFAYYLYLYIKLYITKDRLQPTGVVGWDKLQDVYGPLLMILSDF